MRAGIYGMGLDDQSGGEASNPGGSQNPSGKNSEQNLSGFNLHLFSEENLIRWPQKAFQLKIFSDSKICGCMY